MVAATSFMDQGQVAELEQAIAGVEQQTSAEIVCAVATESGRYDRAEAIFGILFAVLTLVVVNLVVITRDNGPDSWSEFVSELTSFAKKARVLAELWQGEDAVNNIAKQIRKIPGYGGKGMLTNTLKKVFCLALFKIK